VTTLRLQLVHTFATRWCAIFIALFIVSVPFPYQVLPDIGGFFSPFFEVLVRFTADHILDIHRPYTSRLISDSTGLYIHVLNLGFIAVIGSFVSLRLKFDRDVVRDRTLVISRYYLASQLFIYGFSKVFKWQFYLPEPNTLFTPLCDVPRDLLYWSAMGSSHLYTLFGGIAEVIAACLLLLRRTSKSGGLVAAAVMLNVMMINLSYNISVKLYSIFLLFLSILIVVLSLERTALSQVQGRNARLIKAAVVLLILTEGLWLYVSTERYNDDLTERPPLHGAYDVQQFVSGDTIIPPLLTDPVRWRRVFVHRHGYFIVQTMNDKMRDFDLRYDTAKRNLVLIDPRDSSRSILAYNKTADSTLQLAGTIGGRDLHLQLKQINLDQLPLLKPEFNWTIDR
jgi:uncharacterized membrane protein YphA (DoxX/SURF4 family)